MRGAESLLDVVYPRNCVCCAAPACERRDDAYRYLCPECAENCVCYNGPHCETCGLPMPGIMRSVPVCPECAQHPRAFSHGQTLGAMDGALRAMVHALKYSGIYRVVDDMMRLCRTHTCYLEQLKGAVLVPVPLFGDRQRHRGYNQSERIAAALSAAAESTQVRLLLRRTRRTASQTHLDREARQKNMQGAFGPARKGGVVEKARLHVLVDDVFTTGATLNAAAQALRRMGVHTVHVATIAHG